MQDFRMLVLTPSTVHHHNGGGEVHDLYTTTRYTIYTPQKVGAYVLLMGHPSGLGICLHLCKLVHCGWRDYSEKQVPYKLDGRFILAGFH